MPIKRIKQKGGDFPSPWGYNEGSFFVVERPGQTTQHGGKSFPTKEETDSTCDKCTEFRAGRVAEQKYIAEQKQAALKAADAKCMSAKTSAQLRIEDIKANAQAKLESELAEAKINNDLKIHEGCKSKESLVHNANEEKIQALVSEYEAKVRAELESAGVSKNDAKQAAQVEASTLLKSDTSEIVISDDVNSSAAVANALNKLSNDVNIVYIDKDYTGKSNYQGADEATLQAAASAISSGSFTGESGATGALVFSGGGKYFVHNPRNRKNYRENTRSPIGKKLVNRLLRRLRINKLSDIKSISKQVGGNIYFPKEKIIYLSKGGALEASEAFNNNNLGYVYQTQGGKSKSKSRPRKNRSSKRRSNRKSSRRVSNRRRNSSKRIQRRTRRKNYK